MTPRLEVRARGAGVDALDRRHVGVEAAVADLHVALAGQAGGWSGRRRSRRARAVRPGQQRLEPGVRLDLDRVRAAVLRRGEQVARHVARRDPVRRSSISPRCTKSWQTPAPPASRSSTVEPDVGGSRLVLEAVRDRLDERARVLERGVARRWPRRSSSIDRVVGLVAGRQQELAGRPRGRPARPARPSRAAGGSAGSMVTTRARTSIDSCSCGSAIAELDDLGAEVVDVAAAAAPRDRRAARTRRRAGSPSSPGARAAR